jgi:hypothetical protein
MDELQCMDEDWELLLSFLPGDWRELAVSEEALKGLRRDKDEEKLLRTILLHVGCGHSLRETVVRARKADLAHLSDVALLKRLRKCENWLYRLSCRLFGERGIGEIKGLGDRYGKLRVVDGSQVKEPGKTGSLWRIHYSLELPSLRCDFFELTPAKGAGTGESLTRFEVSPGQHILADRGYSNAKGLFHVVAGGADLTVRLCPTNVRLNNCDGNPFPLDRELATVEKAGQIAEWPIRITDGHDGHPVSGRLCVLRKSQTAIELARKKLRKRAQKSGETIQEETWFRAEFVIIFTTVPAMRLSAEEVLGLYRIRWQVELVFKRFKQLAGLGHLPKHDDASSRSWLYGKLFVSLLTEKIISHAESFSPWGYGLQSPPPNPKPVAGVPSRP